MPKDVSERIIDSPFAPTSRGGSVSIGGGGGGGGGATNLDALTDVSLSAPSNGQMLAYNSGSGQWVNTTPATMVAHALSGAFHTGLLNWNLINFTPSDMADITTRRHIDLQGMTPNDHHNQAHVLATGTALGADHTISGAAAGEVLRALTATTAAFDVLQHTDLGNVLPDQHHTRAHDIITGDASGVVHTIVGSQFQVVGATATNVLGLLTPSANPGANAALLRTDANGAIQLDGTLFYIDAPNNWIGINRVPSGATLDVIASANADHTQRIKQKSGQTGRMWRIEDLSGNELIVLDSVGNLQSGRPGFVSGLTGWQITPQGNAEFNNIWARGELHATVFVKDEVHATGGTLLVATAGTLHDDAVISSATVDDDVLTVYSTPAGMGVPLQVVTTSGTFVGNELHVSWIGNFINVNDPPSGPGFYFQPGDIVRSKTEVATGVTDFWLEINSATQNSGYATYSVFKRSGTDGTLPKGSAVVSYGKEGDGRILLTSDLNYAPYIDVFTVGPNVWTGDAGAILPRMRMGRLDGIGLPGVSGVEQYGMIAGQNLADANSGYLIASNLQFSLYKINIRLNNGTSDTGLWTADGNLSIGSNIGALATTGFQVITTGARSGDVVIGNESSGNFLRWQQATGILTVTGSLILSDPGGTVTKSYVDSQDVAYDSLAQGYGTTAQNTAQTFSEARRIVGVNGSWDSPTATTIRWGTKAAGGVALSASFSSGGTRTIADHAGSSVSVTSRTYLYVSVAGTGTMTMATTTNIATVAASANNVLVAVCDPGDVNTKKCSITVVAGSTYISGSNIFTGSIVAANIAARTITAGLIATGTITANEIAANTITAAEIDSSVYISAGGYRVAAVSDTFSISDADPMRVSWSLTTVRKGDGTSVSISASSVNLAGLAVGQLVYLYIAGAASGTTTMATATDPNTIAAGSLVIATAERSADGASYRVVAGGTVITGDNIMTGTVVADNIKSGAVTAAKISVTNLQAVNANTGALSVTGAITVGTTGAIYSAGKTAYADATAGFFLGYSSSLYKFDVGNASNFLRWDGTKLLITTDSPLAITASGANRAVFNFDDGVGGTDFLAFTGGQIQANDFYSQALRGTNLYAPNLIMDATSYGSPHNMITFTLSAATRHLTYDNAGVLSYDGNMVVNGSFITSGTIIANTNTIRIATSFTPTNSSSPAGTTGDIRYDGSYIYVWVSGAWRRAVLNSF